MEIIYIDIMTQKIYAQHWDVITDRQPNKLQFFIVLILIQKASNMKNYSREYLQQNTPEKRILPCGLQILAKGGDEVIERPFHRSHLRQ